MADDLDFLDDEEEEGQDEEFEDDDEFEDEFDDDFEDEFDDEFGDDDDEFAAFGPVYVQGDVSRNFDLIAVVFGFAAAAFSVFLLWTQLGAPVYDNLLSETEVGEINGLGMGGNGSVSFAPRTVRVLGLGKYDNDDSDFDYAVLDAGSDHGLVVGMLFELENMTLAVVKVERRSARADFVDVIDTTQEISVTDSWMDSPDYRVLVDVPTIDNTNIEQWSISELQALAEAQMPSTPQISEPLHRNVVYEASDGAGRYSIYGHLNPQLRLLSEARMSSSAANELDRNAEDPGDDFGYLYFTSTVRANLVPAEDQALLRPIIESITD